MIGPRVDVTPLDWTVVPLNSLLKSSTDLTYGIVQPGPDTAGGIPIVRVRDIRNGRVAVTGPLRVAPEVERSYERSRLEGGELLVTLVGTVGECAVAPQSLRGWNTARAVAVARIRQDIGASWVALCMTLGESRDRIAARVNTTVQTTLNLRDLRQMPVLLPPDEERWGIAATLGALDDKVESNRRLARLAISLALCHVTALTSGRSFEPFSQRMSVIFGAPFAGEHFAVPTVGRPLLRIRDLRTFEPQTWTIESRRDETVIQPGDIVVGMDAEFRAHLWFGVPALMNQRVCRFQPCDGVSRAFVLSALAPSLDLNESAKSGTTVIHLNKADIDRFLVPQLSSTEHEHLSYLTEPLLDTAVTAAKASRTLAKLRDALVPELLSGRIRVPEAREAVAEVVDAPRLSSERSLSQTGRSI